MHPSWGYLSLGLRDVRASPPPVPEDAARRATNRAHAEVQKRQKDAMEANCTRKILACEGLDNQKCPMDVPALAPLKALKVSPSSIAHWVVEAQAAMQHGVVPARADPKELVTQGEDAKATSTQGGEGAPLSCKAKARGSDEAKASLVAEATEVEAPRTSEAEATEVGVPRTTEAVLAGARAPETTKAMMVEARAPRTTEAGAA
ncbi:uncharacterized protein [Miscanthus floridulus]|uniref:uncharacterized protein n=1 Tax=Miscanthus floridulus TaxID=154761 RepID=UPI00345871B7